MASWRFMPWVATLRAVTQTSEEETWNIRDRNHLFLFQPKPKLPRPTCTKTETESEHLISTETKSSFRPLFSGVCDLCRCGISPDDFLAFWNLLESLPNEYNLLVFTFHLNVADFKKNCQMVRVRPSRPGARPRPRYKVRLPIFICGGQMPPLSADSAEYRRCRLKITIKAARSAFKSKLMAWRWLMSVSN